MATNANQLPDPIVIEEIYNRLRPAYEALLHDISRQLEAIAAAENLSVTIKCRVKSLDNYCDKLVKLIKLQGNEHLQITDLLGVRVVCPFLEDLEIFEQLIARKFEILEMEHKAEQHSFREFGYDSVHFLIRTEPLKCDEILPHSSDVCEIQLRTILQEAWAEVEHELVYKSDITLPNHSIRRKLASLNASLTLSDLIFQEIRDNQKEIRRRGELCRQNVESLSGDYSNIDISRPPTLEEPILDMTDTPAQLPPGKLEKLMLSALEAHSNSHFQKAIDIYTIILQKQLDPAICSLVYNHRGMARFALAEYPQGIEDFNRALEYDEDNTRAWINRGLAHRVVERFDQSLEDYDRAIEMAPQRYEGYWGRAQTCYEMKLYSRALSDCRNALKRKPDFAPAGELEKTLLRKLF